MDLPIQWEGWRHHHWLLIRLALKTGDVTRIWSAYGEGGLAGLMGLSEEVHSPDDFRVPQVGWGFSGCTARRFYLIKYSTSSDKVFSKEVTGSSPTRDMHIRLSGNSRLHCCKCEIYQLQQHHGSYDRLLHGPDYSSTHKDNLAAYSEQSQPMSHYIIEGREQILSLDSFDSPTMRTGLCLTLIVIMFIVSDIF